MTASLRSLIKFRLLADQLSKLEFTHFVTALVRVVGRDIILSSLFMGFSNSDSNDCKLDPSLLDTVIELLENVMRARNVRKQKPKDVEPNPLSINSLSPHLIGHVASFCNLEDHIDFGRCSRAIWHGSNSPNTLQKLDLREISDYSLVDLSAFPQLRILMFCLNEFNDLPLLPDQTVCRHLKKMVIDNEKKNEADIDWILSCTALPFDQISHLQLVDFGGQEPANKFSTRKLLELLSKFSNVSYLGVQNVYHERFTAEDDEMLTMLLPNLQTFCDRGTTVDVGKLYGRKLKAVQIHSGLVFLPNPPIDLFESLEEMEIDSPLDAYGPFSNMIRGNCRKLKRVFLESEWAVSSDTNCTKQWICDLLLNCAHLEQLVIRTPIQSLEAISSALERGLFRIADREMERLEIKLLVTDYQSMQIFDILLQITKVVNHLSTAKIKNWLFMWRFRNCSTFPDRADWKREMKQFKARNQARFDITFSKKNILISNKDCALGGCIQNYVWNDGLREIQPIL